MTDLKISLCLHPTTVVFVDDDDAFLTQLSGRFIGKLPHRIFNKQKEALHFLNDTSQQKNFTTRCLSKVYDEDEPDHVISDVNLKLIQQEALLSERFSEVAIVVVDYTMPLMNGIELCKQISNKNIFVILLTGEADEKIAVNEFNNGHINKYFKKTTENLSQELYKSIKKLEQEYFLTQSKRILNQIGANNRLACLSDQAVADVFYALCEQYRIVEYYLINNTGSYILFDETGKCSWFALLAAEELEKFYDFANEDQAPNSVLEPLKNKTKIPLFYTNTHLKTPPAEWEVYLHPATVIKGSTNYYYSYITELAEVEKSPISSYKDYLAKF